MLNDPSIVRLTVNAPDKAASREQRGVGLSLLQNLHGRLKLGGVTVGRDHARMADGTLVEVRVDGPINHIIITPPPGAVEHVIRVNDYVVPDFISGAVMNAGQAFYPTVLTQLPRGDLYKDSPTHAPDRVQLSIPDAMRGFPLIDTFENGRSGDLCNEYKNMRPGDYTGKMRKLAQLLMGYGVQSTKSLYSHIEQGEFDLPDGEWRKILFMEEQAMDRYYQHYFKHAQTAGSPLPYLSVHQSTCGLHIDPDGNAWLVMIGANIGLVVMLLPLHEHTTDEKFRRLCANVPYRIDSERTDSFEDTAALAALDLVGGIPLAFGDGSAPTSEPLLVAIYGGFAKQLLTPAEIPAFENNDAAPLYEKCGWSFNEDGNEAHTVVFKPSSKYENATNEAIKFSIKKAVHYKISLSIKNFKKEMPAKGVQSDFIMTLIDRLDKYSSLSEQTKYGLWYKARYMSEKRAGQLLAQVDNDLQGTLDGFVNDSVAFNGEASATITEVESVDNMGYSPGAEFNGGVYKYNGVETLPAYDAPVAAYHVGNELRMVRKQLTINSYDPDNGNGLQESHDYFVTFQFGDKAWSTPIQGTSELSYTLLWVKFADGDRSMPVLSGTKPARTPADTTQTKVTRLYVDPDDQSMHYVFNDEPLDTDFYGYYGAPSLDPNYSMASAATPGGGVVNKWQQAAFDNPFYVSKNHFGDLPDRIIDLDWITAWGETIGDKGTSQIGEFVPKASRARNTVFIGVVTDDDGTHRQ